MKQSFLRTALLSCVGLCLLNSCQKNNNGDVWNDSSMGSYKRAKERVLWGEPNQEEVAVEALSATSFSSPSEDFIALAEEDLKQQFSEATFAQAKHSPGDEGSYLPGIEGFQIPTAALAQVFRVIYFDTDQSSIKHAGQLEPLYEMASYLKSHPNTYIFVEGHCDQRAPEAYNLALGTRRANSVRNFLIEQGVHVDQIHTVSYGK